MMYLLMETVDNGYEGSDSIPVFASPNKDACEKKHDDLVIRNRFYKKISKHFDSVCETELAHIEIPKRPDYSKLPVKPLVWECNKWVNQYEIEHSKLMEECCAKRKVIIDSIKTELAAMYKVDEKMIAGGWDTFNPTYSIIEVESDI